MRLERRHNYVITKNIGKQWENADLGGTKQNIYRWKGFDEHKNPTAYMDFP